jgi:formate-dependent nitrite reductase cytochrome c552 subunit
MNITSKINKIKQLCKGCKNEEEIKEICKELQGEVKETKTYGDPIVELY